MGLKLQGIPSVPATREALAGRTVAIDAPNLLYAFYTVQLLHQEPTPERREAALRSALRGLLQRTQDLVAFGARPVVVFDGPPHALKLAHLEERAATRAVPGIQPSEYAPVVEALRAAKIPHVQAPHDAEAQACAMARRGLVDVVATTDWDALAMGAPRLLRNLSANPAKAEGRRWSMVECSEALAFLGARRETLAAAAVLMGCDYFPGFPGVGPKKAFKLLQDGPVETAFAEALRALGADGDARALATGAFRLMLDPPCVDCELPKVARGTTLDRFA